jgi:indolepyruvate ferredoxin oxidoreductase
VSTSAVAIDLRDKFRKRSGRILLTGVQALVRLMLVQADRDKAAGLKTGGFVSGYRGSPLGTLDSAFATVKDLTGARGIVVMPAINEEMAATAVAGTQQISRTPTATVAGVFSLWYGKGPGLERAADAIRHGNVLGSSPHGGVLLAVGDDHVAKSSSIICNSDETVVSLQLPLFYPADAADLIHFGLHGFNLSRHTGSWAAIKIVPEIADATHSILADEMLLTPALPEIEVPQIGLHNSWPSMPLEQEVRLKDFRLPAVAAYVRANGLDRTMCKQPTSRVGIIAAGKSWLDMREALSSLGLDHRRLLTLGIALYKPGLIWPLEPQSLREFAEGLSTLIIVEEKGPLIENQVKSLLYGSSNAPAVLGKLNAAGRVLLPSTGDLTPEKIAAEVGGVLHSLTGDEAIATALADARAVLDSQADFSNPPTVRRPHFCSGCPHNRSTSVPEGSRATAGIGCHGLAAYFVPRTSSFSQMGGEGVHWVGLSPFTNEPHMFANIGDGTYFHSGILAIRQAVAAKTNITYKLLYNSAVAMTGGQSVDGELSVPQLVEQLRAEGVSRVVVVSDDPDKYSANDPVRRRATVEHRDALDQVQLALREVRGVSILIYEQMCATESRRQRKRGKLPEPTTRAFINDLVCEGCGDCSIKSNCLSVEPIDTPYGVKRRINQSSCNKDLSCVEGFCPSFVTVEGGKVRKIAARTGNVAGLTTLPQPEIQSGSPHQRILVAGIGGTGVVTIGALLSMAAHMKGHNVGVLDQVGMAQKGGAVVSHIHVADDDIGALRILPGQADLVLACDQVVGNAKDVMAAISPTKTHVVANADVSITGEFTRDRNAVADGALLARRLSGRTGAGNFIAQPFARLAERLLGDGIGSNLMMVGFAWQKGWLALDRTALDSAMELNGSAVAMNREAFEWGRRLAIAPKEVFGAANMSHEEPETLDEIIANRAAFLVAYQDRAYADRFVNLVTRVRAAEDAVGGAGELAGAAARGLFKLMAYKDEYEVARLYTDGDFARKLTEQFEGSFRLRFHLAPPLLAKRNASGEWRKVSFGPGVLGLFRALRRLRRIRGTWMDPFGRTAERRTERVMIGEYENVLEEIISKLRSDNLVLATSIAALPLDVRGYGPVKSRAILGYRSALAEYLPRLAFRDLAT